MARPKRRRAEEEEEEEEEQALESEQDIGPSDEDEAAELREEEEAAAAAADDGEDDDDGAAGPSSSKRHRSEYPRGTVKKVRVCNFMTYGTPAVTITPGPRLNLVLGPNGTGKSSLVCALCLGLTGAPRLLGRADNLKDFIRRGADEGWVETTLSGGPGRPDRVIRAEMAKTADGYTTRWRINGVTKNKRDVVELVRGMNIQFDNLCQFLPQDKVVEFARLNPYELLVATEKAIGDASLYDTHMSLIERRNSMKKREKDLEVQQADHDRLAEANQKLERDYQRFEKRQKMVNSIQIIKKKLAWMDVKEAQERAKAASDQERAKEADLKEARKAAKGDERPAKQRQQQAEAARAHSSALLKDIRTTEGKTKRALDKVAAEEAAVRQLREQVSGLAAESATRENNIAVMAKKVAMVQERLDAFGPIPDHSAEVNRLTEQQNELREQVTGLEADKITTMQELHQHNHVKAQKEAALREAASASFQRLSAIANVQGRNNSLRGLFDFAAWVADARGRRLFRGEVVGPLGVEVKVKSGAGVEPKWVDNLEQAMWGAMVNFAVQNRDDERLLTEELRRHNLPTVKIIVITQDITQPVVSKTEELRKFGVVASLNDLFDAGDLARHALNNTCFLDTTYIMSRDDMGAARQLCETHASFVRKIYTPSQCLTYVRSAYGSKDDAHIKTSSLETSRILRATGAASDVDERKQQLQRELSAIQRRIAELQEAQRVAEGAIAPLQEQVDALQQHKDRLLADTAGKLTQRRKLQTAIKQAEKLLADRRASADPLLQAPQLEKKIQAALAKHHAGVTEALAAAEENWRLLQQHALDELSMRELDMQAKAMLSHFEEQRRTISILDSDHKAAVQRAKALLDAYKRAKDAAEEEHPLDAAARAKFGELSDDRVELAADLSELEDKVDSITVSNPQVAQEYRRRKDEIEVRARALADLQAQLQADTAALDTLKSAWLPELQRVVGIINGSFSTNFAQIGCAGEVLLAPHEDYDRFSIQIKVKFRENEELQLLTAHRQSGGERSVSTILYLIALQGVTVTPFRVVDEINQGMDPANERKVFEQLVAASCREGTPQCFLLTPKLLPDLPFTEDITVLNIFNGSLISDATASTYSVDALFGRQNMARLRQQHQGQPRPVPVAG